MSSWLESRPGSQPWRPRSARWREEAREEQEREETREEKQEREETNEEKQEREETREEAKAKEQEREETNEEIREETTKTRGGAARTLRWQRGRPATVRQ